MLAHFQDILFLQNLLILQCSVSREKVPLRKNTHIHVFIYKQIYVYLFINKMCSHFITEICSIGSTFRFNETLL